MIEIAHCFAFLVKVTNHMMCLPTGDVELIAKLDEELKHEKASGVEDAREQKASIDYVLDAGEWKAKDAEKGNRQA